MRMRAMQHARQCAQRVDALLHSLIAHTILIFHADAAHVACRFYFDTPIITPIFISQLIFFASLLRYFTLFRAAIFAR